MKRIILSSALILAGVLASVATPQPESQWASVGQLQVCGDMTDGSTMTVTVLNREAVSLEADSEGYNPVKFEAVVTEPGTLAEVIGDRLNSIDEIAVRGLIGEADFATLWQASFEGKLKVVDLSKAYAVGDVVPANAFYHQDVQMDPVSYRVKSIALEKLLLPQGITEIGEAAASYCSNLEKVNFSTPLKKIGSGAFFGCTSLEMEQLVFPEGLEEIGNTAFHYLPALTGEVVLPATLKSIGSDAFSSSGITKVTFNGPVFIGNNAFSTTKLTSVELPDGCTFSEFSGGQFRLCYNLTDVKLPADLKAIPMGMFSDCPALNNVKFPACLEEIGSLAFTITGLTELQLPEGLKTIGEEAFDGCPKLETIHLPSSVESIEDRAFWGCYSLKDVYSKIVYPSAIQAFSDVDYKNAILYIPEGTKELYSNTEGWKKFVNLVEVPAMGGVAEIGVDAAPGKGEIYDLYGRRVTRMTPGQVYIREGKKFMNK